jgi:hypothetical protein
MREQPVVPHADSKADSYPPQQRGECEGVPTEFEYRCQCAGVKQNHEERIYPDDWLLERPVTF